VIHSPLPYVSSSAPSIRILSYLELQLSLNLHTCLPALFLLSIFPPVFFLTGGRVPPTHYPSDTHANLSRLKSKSQSGNIGKSAGDRPDKRDMIEDLVVRSSVFIITDKVRATGRVR
jgi:hypothetical protein